MFIVADLVTLNEKRWVNDPDQIFIRTLDNNVYL